MHGEVVVGAIEVRLVVTRVPDTGFEIVGDNECRHTAEVLEHAHVGAEPVGERLRPGGFGIQEAARAKHADEQLGVAHLAGGRIDDVDRLPGVIDEDLLARLVLLTQHGIELCGPRAIENAEPRVLIPVGIRALVLLPEQLERHALALELAVDSGPIGKRTRDRFRGRCREEPCLERRRVIEFRRQWPWQAGRSEAAEVITDSAVGRADTLGDLADAPPTLVGEAEDFNDLAHG